MPKITYKAGKFGKHWGPHLTGTHTLDVKWEDIIWAAITVGKPSIAHLFAYGAFSLSDLIVRTHSIYANLSESRNRFMRSDLYNNLDPTEKGATSYFLGMVMAKLVSDHLFSTPWLFHLSSFQATTGPIKLSGKSQPDLIGINTKGQWLVIEAKGRTGGYSKPALIKAKDQTRQLRKINNQYPSLRVGSLTYFNPDLKIAVEDPPEFEEDAIDIKANEDTLFRQYYSYIYDVTTNSNNVKNIDGNNISFYHFKELDISIGINNKIRNLLDSDEVITSTSFKEILDREEDENADRDGRSNNSNKAVISYPDGLSIQLGDSWMNENMMLQPDYRNRD